LSARKTNDPGALSVYCLLYRRLDANP
jgi:hypothetical protein